MLKFALFNTRVACLTAMGGFAMDKRRSAQGGAGTEGGHFRRHRDNTTKGTAHRRFAVSLFLNSGDYEGGLLRFPEFGSGLYTAPPGGAVVFSCSLVHEATPVTRGRRFMFLPFLYDDAARRIREENFRFFGTGISGESKDADQPDAAEDAR